MPTVFLSWQSPSPSCTLTMLPWELGDLFQSCTPYMLGLSSSIFWYACALLSSLVPLYLQEGCEVLRSLRYANEFSVIFPTASLGSGSSISQWPIWADIRGRIKAAQKKDLMSPGTLDDGLKGTLFLWKGRMIACWPCDYATGTGLPGTSKALNRCFVGRMDQLYFSANLSPSKERLTDYPPHPKNW